MKEEKKGQKDLMMGLAASSMVYGGARMYAAKKLQLFLIDRESSASLFLKLTRHFQYTH